MVLINPPLLVLVRLLDFQVRVQSHRSTRLEIQCGHLLAVAQYHLSDPCNRARAKFSVLSESGGVADGWATTSAPIRFASSIVV